ncbi:MAG: hypothetical protein LQ351_006159 [Letrouitia transgressa]|nr:MAG: hypothetical protein LQ351_006159 [Letrouitia transgressa]
MDPPVLRIGVVGGGWYGCHLALDLSKDGHEVEIFEKRPDIFQGVSGNFGIRLHKGPHYPRSKYTRESCHLAFEKFCDVYPDLIVPHEQAIYAQGDTDALGNRSKVSDDAFSDVCHESSECQVIDPYTNGFRGLNAAFNLDEPSIVIGQRLRSSFREKLEEASIKLHLSSCIEKVSRDDNVSTLHLCGGGRYQFDLVVNATGYQSLVPQQVTDRLPVDMEVTYQTCIALCYEDLQPRQKPFSFIVMDGWFPCVMPAIDTTEQLQRNYILTHGSYTILGSFERPEQGEALLNRLDDAMVSSKIRPSVEKEISRFWPGYLDRFVYSGWKGSVLAKLKTCSEFRSSVTFEHDGVVHVFPGKVSNVFNSSDELKLLVKAHVRRKYVRRQYSGVRCLNGLTYAMAGALSTAQDEIEAKPLESEHHTSNLQSYRQLVSAY